MDNDVKKRIEWWNAKYKNVYDPFFRFFIYYMCFDAWLIADSGKSSDNAKRNWFKNHDNILKQATVNFWDSSDTQKILKSLQKCSPIYDTRPESRFNGRSILLTNINDKNEVVDFIYQIRCSLFHGSSSWLNKRDNELALNAGKLLKKWIQNALLKLR